ncbi:helix-turn-helix transcriptional regulator [Variovorax sp. LT1R20]|uniref:helix-turn-helix transcriptional regulator n=1 Tax=Variovorax sp. LT1R20 TaxID=3443729 RepID=UPI003F460B49
MILLACSLPKPSAWSRPPPLKVAPGDCFLRIQEVERRVCLKKSAIYARMATGAFPRSISLGRRCTVWLKSSIDGWINEQIERANNLALSASANGANQARRG